MIGIIDFQYKMKDLSYMLKESLGFPCGIQIDEMAFATNDVKLGKQHYRVALHGVAAGDRPYPHIHIYLENDHYPWKKFNFEISLVDLICDDELNLVCQQDRANGIDRRNRKKCDWKGYRDLRDDFEDWLEDKCTKPGNFINNLHFLIYTYNEENNQKNSLQNYVKSQGKSILTKYKKYFE